MTALGGALAAIAIASLVLAVRPASVVVRRLALVAPSVAPHPPRWRGAAEVDLRHAGLGIDPASFVGVKLGAALGAAVAAAVASLVVPIGPAAIAVAAYVGYVGPSMLVERRASTRRADADVAVSALVERVEALVAAGRPPETALVLLMRRPTGSVLLDRCLGSTLDAYALGAPLFRTLAARARAEGLATCAAVAEDLERARDMGTGSIGVIRDRRSALRASERARSLEAAAQVEGKLMLVLVLCYLPALILLVVVPLFIGLLDGLFA